MNSETANRSTLPVIPEPWTARDTLRFGLWGLVIFIALFAFMFSLSSM